MGLAHPDGVPEDGKPCVNITNLTGDGKMDSGEIIHVRLVFDGGAK